MYKQVSSPHGQLCHLKAAPPDPVSSARPLAGACTLAPGEGSSLWSRNTPDEAEMHNAKRSWGGWDTRLRGGLGGRREIKILLFVSVHQLVLWNIRLNQIGLKVQRQQRQFWMQNYLALW